MLSLLYDSNCEDLSRQQKTELVGLQGQSVRRKVSKSSGKCIKCSRPIIYIYDVLNTDDGLLEVLINWLLDTQLKYRNK